MRDTIRRKYLSLQTATKILQRRSTDMSHCCGSSVCRRHLHELGAIPIKLVTNRLQRCAGHRCRISLRMADHSHSFHGMVRTRIHHLCYHTTARGSKISHPESWATSQAEEGEQNCIRSIPTRDTGSHRSSMENNTKFCRTIWGHR
jgi:hypothetical protein